MIHGDQRQHSQFWQIFILGQNSVKLLASYKFNLTRRTMTLPVCQMQLLCTLMNWNCFILQNWGKQWRADISFSTKTLHFPSMFISSAKTIAALDSNELLRLVRLLTVSLKKTVFYDFPKGRSPEKKGAVFLDFVQMRGGGSCPIFFVLFHKCIFGQ